MLDKYINFNGLATKHKRVTVLHMHYFGSHYKTIRYRCCLWLYTRLPINGRRRITDITVFGTNIAKKSMKFSGCFLINTTP